MNKLQNIIIQLSLFAFLLMGGVLLYSAVSGKQLSVTGQTTEYNAYDDGTYQAGINFPSTRFFDNGDGTVIDNMTGLMWLQSPDSITRNWETAIAYCDDLNYAGHSDWRLPSINELETLKNYSQGVYINWLNSQGFTDIQLGFYWSSTTATSLNNNSAWCIAGYVSYIYSKVDYYYVLPVRTAAP
ncbi:MAG: DUF1566 domain-containing protein [Spirochaetes bacterium]|nr:DUF1566 domain-containing protein [Spirochaetota bacterium]MBN2770327.1 DUF1566 domain-containing protein [Spirochaetota bacterium]